MVQQQIFINKIHVWQVESYVFLYYKKSKEFLDFL